MAELRDDDDDTNSKVSKRTRWPKQSNTTQPSDGERYTLTSAMLIVRQIETSHTRLAVFTEIKEKNKIINAIDNMYTKTNSGIIRRLIIIAYMLKSVVSLDTNTTANCPCGGDCKFWQRSEHDQSYFRVIART